MSIGSKMRSLGDSTYFLKATYEPLKEIMGDEEYEIAKDPIRGFIVHTDRINSELLESVDDLLNDEFGKKFRKSHYNHNIEISWRVIDPGLEPMLAGKYEECKTLNDIIAVDENYLQDVTPSGAWSCLLTNFESNNGKWSTFGKEDLTTFNVPMPNLREAAGMFSYAGLKRFDWPLDNLVNARQMFYLSSIERFETPLPNATDTFQMFYATPITVFRSYIPKGGLHCICAGAKKLEEVVCDLGKRRNLTADQAFDQCISLKK